MIPSVLHATPAQRRRRLAELVATLAKQIDTDEGRVPDAHELRDLAAFCDAFDLPLEAARVRSWLPSEFETIDAIVRLLKGDDA